MSTSYTSEFHTERTPLETFDAINRVPEWWMAQMTGSTGSIGDEFSYDVTGLHAATMRVTELVPGERIVWRVVKSHMTFVADPAEWEGTDITFELTPDDGGTRVRFTHVGLVPEHECYDICDGAWGLYFGSSLRNYLATGVGTPSSNPDERADVEVAP